jgi:hypothetical protein
MMLLLLVGELGLLLIVLAVTALRLAAPRLIRRRQPPYMVMADWERACPVSGR